ncbi:MAG: hypothetical protein M1820_000102 [Bogoriella megaspora]|nr:MAG: hypothetical protein M1820_000102 [Bogoriella megaspora]
MSMNGLKQRIKPDALKVDHTPNGHIIEPKSPHPAGPPKHNSTVQYLRLIAFVLLFAATLIAIHFAQLILALLYFVDKDYFYAGQAVSKQSFGIVMVVFTQWFCPTKIRISGDESVRGQLRKTDDGRLECDFPHRLVLIANHQIYTEWTYLWWIAYTSGMHGHFYIILKESLKWIPILGPAMQLFRFIFLARNWEKDRPRFQHRFDQLNTRHGGPMSGPEGLDPMWLLIFPEGTNLSSNSREASQKWAEKSGVPDMKHCLLPRATGLQFCLSQLTGTLDYVYDITIAYEGIPNGEFGQDLFGLWSSYLEGRPPKSVNLHFRRFAVKDIPVNDMDKFNAWLRECWTQKDELLDYYQNNGRFPADEGVDAFDPSTSPKRVAVGVGHIETAVQPTHILEILQVFVPTATFLLMGNIMWKMKNMLLYGNLAGKQ